MKPKRIVIDGKQECITCHQWLPLDSFHVHKASSTGRNWRCRECHKSTNFGGLTPSQRARKWAVEHPEQSREINHRSSARIIHNESRLQARREANLRAYYANKEKYQAAHEKWRRRNPWASIADKSRTLVRMTVKGSLDGGPKFLDLVGCTGSQLRRHLQKHWQQGMGWHNFGRGGWTIGHIRSCAEWKDQLLIPEALRECFHFSNLQPEWEHTNMCKHVKQELTAAQCALLKTPEKVTGV